MSKPRIGMIPSLKDSDPHQLHPSAGCIEGVARAGGEVVVIDYLMNRAEQDALILSLDAMLFQGGGDIESSRFGAAIHPACNPPNLMRDELELRAFSLLFPKDVPMMGICRGVQLLNVALGGNLYQDLPSEMDVVHQLGEQPQQNHVVTIAPGSHLLDIVQDDRFPTNSLHHQSIKQLGRGLVAVAHTPDGIIEAIELPSAQFLVGLQWHPEITIDDDLVSMRLFHAFVDSI